jgi:prevent-host-death family protein
MDLIAALDGRHLEFDSFGEVEEPCVHDLWGLPDQAVGAVGVTSPGVWAQDCATMCYMSESGGQPARVGVRELRQNLSVYLDRVKAGETLEVTEHGHPVAQLGPRPTKPVSILDQMIADGRATPATLRPRDIPPPLPNPDPDGPTLTEILLQMRDEDDR